MSERNDLHCDCCFSDVSYQNTTLPTQVVGLCKGSLRCDWLPQGSVHVAFIFLFSVFFTK